jgi:hypothetical protein
MVGVSLRQRKRGEMRADWIMESVFMDGLGSGFGGFFEQKENREVINQDRILFALG